MEEVLMNKDKAAAESVIYSNLGVIWHQHSNRLMEAVIKLFNKEKVVLDFGCGHNFYVSVLRHLGYSAIGFDMVDMGSKYFIQKDITKEFRFPVTAVSNIISLEVGEHIPAELADIYLDNITAYKGDIIMSWAVEGQAGIGHINCRNNDWVIEQMNKRGYNLDKDKTDFLRKAVISCHCNWFLNTLMYFTPIV